MKKMTKLAVAGTVLAMSAAHAAPTIYGQLNKEIRYVDQDKTTYAKNMHVVDVENSESRLGAKGTEEVSEGLKAHYKLELGLNSTATDDGTSTSGRLRMRESYIGLETMAGTLTLGQTYTALSNMVNLGFDFLQTTGAGLVASDQKKYIVGHDGQIGVYDRSRKDLLGYKTPTFAGFFLEATYDRDDNSASYGRRDANHTEARLVYNNKFGDLGLQLEGGYGHWNDQEAKDEKVMGFAGRFSYMDFALHAYYGTEEEATVAATSTKEERDNMAILAKYKINKFWVAASYATSEFKDAGDNTNNFDMSQMALSVGHKYTDNLEMKLTYATYELEMKNDTASNNKADTVMFGTTLKF